MTNINHYDWLDRNYEIFCTNSGYVYHPGEVAASGDKLSALKFACEQVEVPFHKVAAIGLAIRKQFLGGKKPDGKSFSETCIELYNAHPEWCEGCVDINPD